VLGQSGHEGSILATQSYSAFGSLLSQTGTSNNAQKYTGREQDAETGFYYYRARYYDAVTGRFISEDPKGFGAGVNFYAYAGNNPVNGNDPTGNIVLYFGYTGTASGGPLNVVKGGGIVFDSSGNAAQYNVYGAGGGYSGGGSAALGISFGFLANFNKDSPATTISDFAGPFANASIGRGVGAYTSIDGFVDPYNTNNMGGGFTFGPGIGGGYSVTATNTTLSNITSIFNNNSASNAANGGFVLYPNKPNTNMMQSVYKK
jgi:RHS repeat-associated protein